MVQGNSHNIPHSNATTQPRNQQYAQPEKYEKEFCIIGGESRQQVSIQPTKEN